MTDEDDFKAISDLNFITAKQMVIICVCIELIIQSFALIIEPTAWWTWQLLGFIVATNLGAVILAVFAQKSADDISKVYGRIFTPEFYYTVKVLTDFRGMIEAEAEKEGRNMNEELEEIAPKVYALTRKYLDARYAQDLVVPPNLDDLGIVVDNLDIEKIDDNELFEDDAE